MFGVVAGWTWMPCVGEQLAGILNNAPNQSLAQLLPMVVYVLGVCAVLFVFALAPLVFEQLKPLLEHRATRVLGTALAAALVVALAGGVYNDLLSRFAQLSVR